jgi:transcriptional regulator with XRE-family HTH domain
MNLQFTPRPTRLQVRFPNRIREYRLKAGLSQRSLAGLLGLQRNAISAWERGISSPVVSHLFRMAKTLGTLAESLYLELYSPAPPKEEERKAPKKP